MKHIWVPVGTPKITVSKGTVTVTDEMTFVQQIVAKPQTGFGK